MRIYVVIAVVPAGFLLRGHRLIMNFTRARKVMDGLAL